MKIKCENVIICGNYNCAWNCDCHCGHEVIALDGNGKCSLEKPKAYVKTDAPAQIKHNAAFDVEASK